MAIIERPTPALTTPAPVARHPRFVLRRVPPARHTRPAGGRGCSRSTTRSSGSCTASRRCSSSSSVASRRCSSGPSWPDRTAPILSAEQVQPDVHDARHDDDLPLRHADGRRRSPTTSCRCRSAPATSRSRASTPSASGASCSAASSSTRHGSSAARPTVAGSCTQPNSSVPFSPTHGVDFWALGLQITGIASLTGALNLIVTVLNMRAPGMSLMKMPIFTWMVAGRAVPVGVRDPGHHRGAVPADVPALVRRHVLLRSTRAPTRCCGSTCSGSSGIPRCTSSSPVVRHRVRGAAGVLPQAVVRLPVRGVLRRRHRLRRMGRVGPPHVRLRARADQRRRVLGLARWRSPSPPASRSSTGR